MTIQQAIAQADALRPNPLPEPQKVGWVQDLERRTAREVGAPVPDFGKESDGQLSIAEEYSMLYVLYLCAMIDLALGEYESYDQTAQVFNTLADRYKKQYLRSHLPPAQGYRHLWEARE